MNDPSKTKWGPVQIDRSTGEKLIKQILKGTIERDEFPEVWTEPIVITFTKVTHDETD